MNTNKLIVALVLVIGSVASIGCSAGYQTDGWRGKDRFAGFRNQPVAAPAYAARQQGTPVVVYGPQPGSHSVVSGPGGNVAALGSPIAGCEAPFRVDVYNQTEKFLQLMIDGNSLPINGAGTMPYLPPRTTLHICLAHPGTHILQGVAYLNRLGQFREVSRFQRQIVGRSRSVGTPYNVYRLEDSDISYMEP